MSGLMSRHAKRHALRLLLLRAVALGAVVCALTPLWQRPLWRAAICGLLGVLAVRYFYGRAVRSIRGPSRSSRSIYPLIPAWQESFRNRGWTADCPVARRWVGAGETL